MVRLDPTLGSEINKTRPCLIISPNEMNKFLRTTVVAPMTTRERAYPTRVKIKHNDKVGWVALDQIRTIDKKKVVKFLGKLSKQERLNCKSVIKETFVD